MNRILVVGGNGFIGSAVCKAALAKGFQVTSISSSGRPYRTAKGHSPAWVSQVDWQTGDALKPETYAHLLPKVSGVVHSVGILLEDDAYKASIQNGDIPGLVGAVFRGMGISHKNPLEEKKWTYNQMNRDTALRVCESLLASTPEESLQLPRPFVFISAEDFSRPFVPHGYIESKRQAEEGISRLTQDSDNVRPVFIRPSLVYHAHHRPLISPAAALLDLSATLHAKVPSGIPTPSSVLRSLNTVFSTSTSNVVRTSSLDSIANALTLPPVHVDHVAEAVCAALNPDRVDIHGPIGIHGIRELTGWAQKGQLHGLSTGSANV